MGTYRPRYFGRRRSSGRRLIARRWTGEGTQVENTTAAGAVTISNIVTEADYQQTASLEQAGVTVARVRGCFACRATLVGTIVAVTIIAYDAQEVIGGGSGQPLTLQGDLASGQVLWRWTTIVPTDTTRHTEFDIRVKRRLQETRIALVVTSFVNATTWHYSARALLLGG